MVATKESQRMAKCQVLEIQKENDRRPILYINTNYPKYDKSLIIKECNKEGKAYKVTGICVCRKHRSMWNIGFGRNRLDRRDDLTNAIGDHLEIHYSDKGQTERYMERVKEMTTNELEELQKELAAVSTLEQVIIDRHLK